MRAIIDADSLLYKVLYGSESKQYQLFDTSTFDVVFQTKTKKQIHEQLDLLEMSGVDTTNLMLNETTVEPDFEEIKEQFKLSLLRLQDNVSSHFDVDSFTYFIGGKGNFRYDLATIQKYKGNRILEKPKYYDSLKQYASRLPNFVVVDDIEADDAVSTIVYNDHVSGKNEVVLCAIDKDLRNTPCTLYNYNNGSVEYIGYQQASYNFAKQILTGDSVDNIQGVKGIGSKRADSILRHLNPDIRPFLYDDGHFVSLLVECRKVYESKYKDGLTTEDGKQLDYIDIMIENAELLWMRRNENQTFMDYCKDVLNFNLRED